MLFSSLTFIYLFLPMVIIFAYLVPRRYVNHALVLASLVFYSWGGVIYLSILISSILLNYFVGKAMYNIKLGKSRQKLFILGIISNLILLAVFKYTNFMVDNVNLLSNIFGINPLIVNNIILPLGISFYTFKAITFLVSIKNNPDPNLNFVDFSMYLSFFPQVIAGPIDRYDKLSPQIKNRNISFEKFASGIKLFSLGLIKKVIISSPLAYVADQIFSKPFDDLSIPIVWLGAVSYTLQVYFDFSGYTDMAIGLGRLFGFEFSENFNFPYISRSISEFWRRWHITLSTWLRDYLFQPLAYTFYLKFNNVKHLGKRRDTIIYFMVSIITFLICGLWHGAAWTFILWGLIHGILISLEKTKLLKWTNNKYKFFGHLYFILSIIITFVIFRSSTLSDAFTTIGIMFGIGGREVFWPEILEYLDRKFILIIIIAISGSTPLFKIIKENINKTINNQSPSTINTLNSIKSLILILAIFITLFIVTFSLVSATNNSFLYFKF